MLFPSLELSEETLFHFAATASLLLTIAGVLWPKFAALVRSIWSDLVAAVEAVEHFRNRRRRTG